MRGKREGERERIMKESEKRESKTEPNTIGEIFKY